MSRLRVARPGLAPSRPGTPSTGSASKVSTVIRFEDVTERSGVKFTYRNGSEAGEVAILESLGGGVGLFDFDNDGDLDLCLPGGGHYSEKKGSERDVLGWPLAIYRNDGDWHFTEVTSEAGAAVTTYYSHGAAAADFDNDGFCDVLMTGYGGLLLLWNRGDGTFEEIAKSTGLTDAMWSSTAAWGDFNEDALWMSTSLTMPIGRSKSTRSARVPNRELANPVPLANSSGCRTRCTSARATDRFLTSRRNADWCRAARVWEC